MYYSLAEVGLGRPVLLLELKGRVALALARPPRRRVAIARTVCGQLQVRVGVGVDVDVHAPPLPLFRPRCRCRCSYRRGPRIRRSVRLFQCRVHVRARARPHPRCRQRKKAADLSR